MSDAQIQKQDLWWWEIQKPEKFQNCPQKLFPQWFGRKISEPIDFHDNVVIIQHKLIMFSKKIGFRTDFKVVIYTLMHFRHSQFILSSLGHIGKLANHR